MNIKLNEKNEEILNQLQAEFPHLKPRHWSEILNKAIAGISTSKLQQIATTYKDEKSILKNGLKDKDIKKQVIALIEKQTKPKVEQGESA